jgi:VCBS repeat-containing protein/predicted outer membrane repeat protein
VESLEDRRLLSIGASGADEEQFSLVGQQVQSDALGLQGLSVEQAAEGEANHAPVLDPSGSPALPSVNEDATGPAGMLVSSLISSVSPLNMITDEDPNALKGIAVVGVDNTYGSWQYRVGSSGSWTEFSSPSTTAARLLAADSATWVRFVPALDFNGEVNAGLTFRAWDQTTGTNGGTADTMVNGGATAFSTVIETAQITVIPVNDAPRATASHYRTVQDGTLSARLLAMDVEPDDTLTYQIATSPSHGTILAFDVVSGTFVYQPTAGYWGADSFSFTATDDRSSDTETVTIGVEATPSATFTVNSYLDTVDANPGDGLAQDASGMTSLRAAVMEANALPGFQSIVVPAGTYRLTIQGLGSATAATGDLDLTDSISILGSRAADTIIDATGLNDRIFDVTQDSLIRLQGLTITGGLVKGEAQIDWGGAVRVSYLADVLISDCIVSGNSTPGQFASDSGQGGAISNSGKLTILGSRFENNLTRDAGGAINAMSYMSKMTIKDSTFSGNSAWQKGGAIAASGVLVMENTTFVNNDGRGSTGFGGAIYGHSADLTLLNCTVSGNYARYGGGIYNGGGTQLINCTITANTAEYGGGGFYGSHALWVEKTILAGNMAEMSPDVLGHITSRGNNLIGTTTGCSVIGLPSDLLNVAPKLGPLADNGGPTLTHELLPGSPAIDAVPTTTAPSTDQRGVLRPQGLAADIGAFELVTDATGGIRGALWNDFDGDGVRDAGESGLAGWTVFLDTNHSGQFDAYDPSVLTATDGSYAFIDLPTGDYVVTVVQQGTWLPTAPSPGTSSVHVNAGQIVTGRDFANWWPGLTLVESGTRTIIAEGGTTDSYTVALRTLPSGNVQITATADAQSLLSLDGQTFASSVTFTRSDMSPQTIYVQAIDDAVAEADHTSVITHAITGTVVDANYPLTMATSIVTAAVVDDEGLPKVTLSIDQPWIAENGGVATVTAQLSAVASRDVTVELGLSGTATHGELVTENVVSAITSGGVSASRTRAQTFTVPRGGSLERVEVQIARIGDAAATADLIVEILATTADGVPDPARVLGRVTLPASAIPTSKSFVPVLLGTANYSVQPGDVLAINLRSAAAGYPYYYEWALEQMGDYTGGRAFTRDTGPYERSSDDMGFRVFMNGGDYVFSSGQIVIPQGSTTGTMTITATADSRSESNETALVDIVHVVNGTEFDTQQVVTTIAAPGTTGDLEGTVWDDRDGDGVRDAGELGLAGVTVYLDSNNNSQLDAAETRTATASDNPETPTVDEAGSYVFNGLQAGTYRIAQAIRNGWIQTSPNPPAGTHQVTFVSGKPQTGLDFGNHAQTAPVAAGDTYQVDEDALLTVSAPGVLGNDLDRDSDLLSAILVSGPSHGSLTLNANGSFTYHTGTNYNGSDSFTYKVHDGNDTSNVATVLITVSPINDAPVLDSTGTMRLTIEQDAASNHGIPVCDLIASARGDRISDLDAGALEGIAVIATDTAHGTWEYSTNGSTWLPLNGVSESSARLLAADSLTSIRFVPNANWYGTVDPGITFRAWDQTSGTNGGAADTRVNGGTTAFSVTSETALITVTRTMGDIRGTLWNDLDGDGLRDAEEPARANGQVYLDLNTNGQYDSGEPIATTVADGSYAFLDLPPGPYTIAEIVQPGWLQTFPLLTSQPIERVNVASDGLQANQESRNPSISADGRYVAFESDANNLVPGQPNNYSSIFVCDRWTGEIERVSVALDGSPANLYSRYPSISADGRYVAFESRATNLVLEDTWGGGDIYVYDRQTDTTKRLSNGGSPNPPAISADGRYVTFESSSNIFVYDRQTDATERVTTTSNGTQVNGYSSSPSISANGRYVAFLSRASNLVPGDTNGVADVFVYDQQTGTIERVSITSDGSQANGASTRASISADGRYVTIQSSASNLVPGDTNGVADVFVYDRQTDTIERVSIASDGSQANGASGGSSISADGRYVTLLSSASNLVPGDTNGYYDTFVYDRQTDTIERVSLASDGSQANGASASASISADGCYVAISSSASNLVPGDTNGYQDIFVTQTTAWQPGTHPIVLIAGQVATRTDFGDHAQTAPVAVADTYEVDEDTLLTRSAPGVLANDTDANGDLLSAILVTGPSHGSLTLNANGSFTYQPAANYNGPDSFTYKVNDGHVDSSVATVSITVNPINDPPTLTLSNTATTLAENTSTASRVKVADIIVSDDGQGTNVLSLAGADAALFEIVGNVLYLKTGTTLDYEAKRQLTVIVQVDDSSVGTTPDSAASLSIAINDVNLAPTDLTLSATSLAEDQPAGTVVGTFSTTAPEAPAGPFTYTLVSGPGSADNGCFAISGAQLKTAATLNYEEKTSYSIRVRTTDPGGLWYEEAITIAVTDVTTLGDLLYTLDDPVSAPQPYSEFGDAVATDGDLMVVGSPYADVQGAIDVGVAYVFNRTTGELLATLRSPTPIQRGSFGSSVAISGNTVVVGASDTGAVYVFDATTGVLLYTLANPSPADNDWFGLGVAISGNTVVVGAPGDDTGATDAGTAYVFDAATGRLLCTLANPTPVAEDSFGHGVAVSGNTVVVGAYFDHVGTMDGGTVHVFDATTGRLLCTLANPTPAYRDYFGLSVAVSGNTVVVGTPSDDTGGGDAGAAYVFDATTGRLLHTLANPTPAVNDQFGSSVTVSGSTIVVGTPSDDTGASNAGAAYVFDAATGSLLRTLTNPTPAARNYFGQSVAVSGSEVVVGTPGDETGAWNAGAAYVFDAATGSLLRTLTNPTPAATTYFGRSVAVSGNTVVVGTTGDNTGAMTAGAACVFDATTGILLHALANPTPATEDSFGSSVAISGNTVVVGAYLDDTGATNSGTVYVFDATTGTLLRTLANPTPATYDYFGFSVAVSGNTVVVGAYGDDTGATDAGTVYVFDATTGTLLHTLANPTPAIEDSFGFSVAVSGNTVIVGAYQDDTGATNAGAAYVFDATTGTLLHTLANPTPAIEDSLGFSVAISGNTVVVGAYRDDTGVTYSGAAYVFDATTGARLGTLAKSTPIAGDYFGMSVAISGSTVIVGARYDDTGAPNTGAAYVFDAATGVLLRTLANPTPTTSDTFGASVAVSGSTVVVGAHQDDTGATDAGTVYVFDGARAPIDIRLSSASILENQPAGTLVGTFTTTDPNLPDDHHTYTLVAGSGDTDNDKFMIDGNALRTKASFNYQAKASYSIRVRTTDQNGLWCEKVFTIAVTDVNESPMVTLSNQITVLAENVSTTSHVKVADITVSDDGQGSNILSLAGADAALFEIDGDAIYLKAGESLDYETKQLLNVVVQVDDSSLGTTPDSEASLTITIADVNESPTGLLLSKDQVPEHSAADTLVGLFTTTDPDADNTFTYALVSGEGSDDNRFFAIAGNQLKTTAAFDFETQSSYSIRVRTTDQGGLPLERQFTITATDVDDMPPTVAAVSPSIAGGTWDVDTTSVVIDFSEPVAGGGSAVNYQLQSLGPDALLGTADDTIIPLSVSYTGSSATLQFAPLPESVYRLTIRDTLVDARGNVLDGNRDGLAGGVWAADFVVKPAAAIFEETPTCGSGGAEPSSVATGDFNGDGIADLAVANARTGKVGILLGMGNGTFSTAVSYGTGGSWPLAVAVGDFNADGKSDLAVVNSSSSNVAILLGTGTGTFAQATTFASGGTSPSAVAVGDFNADGKSDLAVANYGSSTVGILLGTGSGTFADAMTLPSGGDYPRSVTVGDFNGDGKSDLAVANSFSSNVAVLLGTGTGTFAQAKTNQTGGTFAASVVEGDFNNDGKSDLAVANYHNGIVGILLGSDNSGFSAVKTSASGVAYPESLISGDFNADGTVDLAVVDANGTVGILLGAGTGLFTATATYSSGGASPVSAATGDFDADGDLDLALANRGSDTVGILLAQGDGTFSAVKTLDSGGFFPFAVAIGDFNADGNSDLAVANAMAGNIGILLGSGSGTFAAAVAFDSGGDSPRSVAVGDFNADGNADLAVANHDSGTVGILLGSPNGRFAPATVFSSGGGNPYSVVVADFNADGMLDLAVANWESDNIGVLLGKGNGTFSPVTAYNTGGTYPKSLAVADFNADGFADLAVANMGMGDGTVGLLLGTGSGTFLDAATFSSGGPNPCCIATGDFNADGKPDLAVTNAAGSIGILFGVGDGTLASPTTYRSGGIQPAWIVVGDFTGDGLADVAVANYSSGTVAVLPGMGKGTFGPAQSYSSGGTEPLAIAVGDFNADRKADLAAVHGDAASTCVLRNIYVPTSAALASPNGMLFDVQVGGYMAGQLIQGTNNAFDGLNRLQVDGADYAPAWESPNLQDGGRTVVTPSQTLSGLTVSREITVPATGNEDFARTVDVFTNPTDRRITTRVRIVGNLGSDGATTVFATSDGDAIVEPTDQWIGTDDADGSGTPAVLHYLHGPGGLQPVSVVRTGDNLEWTYELTVEPGETVRLAHFTTVAATQAEARASADRLVTDGGFGGEAAAFLTESERFELANFNRPPTDLDLSASAVAENQPVETVVGLLATADPDTGEPHTYSLVPGMGDTDNDAFTIVGNELQTKASFNYEAKASYSIRVRTTDQLGQSYEEVFAITITDVSPTPQAGGPYTVSEGGTVVLAGSGLAYGGGSEGLGYAWDFDGDGEFDDATGPTPSFPATLLDGPGTVTIALQVTEQGETSIDTATVTIANVAPGIIELTAPERVGEGLTVTLSGRFLDGFAQDGHTATIDWGDGTSSPAVVDATLGSFAASHVYGSAGQYTVTATVQDDDGGMDQESLTVEVVPHLGAVGFATASVADLAGGERWFCLETARAGYLTVEGLATGGGTLQLELYDVSSPWLSAATILGNGKKRLDIETPAHEIYYLRVHGTGTGVELSVANLVHREGQTINVFGTAGEDEFAFDATARQFVVNGPTYRQLTVNGLIYQFTGDVSVRFDGAEGKDQAVLTGSSSDDSAVLTASGGRLTGSGYRVTLTSIAQTTVDGNGGTDVVYLYGTENEDTFTAEPGQATLAGTGYSLKVVDFDAIHAIGADGGDTAVLRDSAGAERLVAKPEDTRLYGQGFYLQAKGFSTVTAYATAGSADRAEFYDSRGDDTWTASPQAATLTGTGFSLTASGFDTLQANASGGHDQAFLAGSTGRDEFSAYPQYSRLQGAGYSLQANHFDEVRADSQGGDDVAWLYDSLGDDVFVGKTQEAEFSGAGFRATAVGFAEVAAHALRGGQDTARLQGVLGSSTVTVTPHAGKLAGPGYACRVAGFANLVDTSSSAATGTMTLAAPLASPVAGTLPAAPVVLFRTPDASSEIVLASANSLSLSTGFQAIGSLRLASAASDGNTSQATIDELADAIYAADAAGTNPALDEAPLSSSTDSVEQETQERYVESFYESFGSESPKKASVRNDEDFLALGVDRLFASGIWE